jgi:hypothetical protein
MPYIVLSVMVELDETFLNAYAFEAVVSMQVLGFLLTG